MADENKGTGVLSVEKMSEARNEATLAFQRGLKEARIDNHRMKMATAAFGDGWNAAIDAIRGTGAVVVVKE